MRGKSPTPHPSDTALPAPIRALVRDAIPALGFAAALFLALYTAVTTVLHTQNTSPARLSSTVERSVGYLLLTIGYLLLPGIAGLLVRRRKDVAAQRALLDSGSAPSASSETSAACGGARGALARLLPHGRLLSDIDQAAPCLTCKGEKEVQCAVCLGDVCEGEKARTLPCAHSFHAGCAELWLVTGRRNSCPMCLRVVVEGRDEAMVCVKR